MIAPPMSARIIRLIIGIVEYIGVIVLLKALMAAVLVAGTVLSNTVWVVASIRTTKAEPKPTMMMATIIPTIPISPAKLITLPFGLNG